MIDPITGSIITPASWDVIAGDSPIAYGLDEVSAIYDFANLMGGNAIP